MIPPQDAKSRGLRQHGALNPRPQRVTDALFRDRDFFDPRHLARGAGHVLGALDELGELPGLTPAESSDEAALLRLSRRAMATAFEVVVPFGTPDALALGEAAFGLLDELETQLTVYRDASEVCRLNREAPYRYVPAEPRLFGLLGADGWNSLVDDIDVLVERTHNRMEDVPVVLFGHSMGSFAAQHYLLDHSGRIAGLALSGTAAIDLLEPALDLDSPIDLSGFNAPFAHRTGYE